MQAKKHEILGMFTAGAAVGDVMSTLATQHVHDVEGHYYFTYTHTALGRMARFAGNVSTWVVGVDPKTNAVMHRYHHTSQNKTEPEGFVPAIRDVIDNVYVSPSNAEVILENPNLPDNIFLFNGMPPQNDPLLHYDENGHRIGIKRDDVVNKTLGKKLPHWLGSAAVPALFLGGLYSAQRVMGKSRVDSARNTAAFTAGFMVPYNISAIVPGVPEFMDGGDGTKYGRDASSNPLLHRLLHSSVLLHRSHHEDPGAYPTPGTPNTSVDVKMARFLMKIGAIEAI